MSSKHQFLGGLAGVSEHFQMSISSQISENWLFIYAREKFVFSHLFLYEARERRDVPVPPAMGFQVGSSPTPPGFPVGFPTLVGVGGGLRCFVSPLRLQCQAAPWEVTTFIIYFRELWEPYSIVQLSPTVERSSKTLIRSFPLPVS